MSAEVQAMVVYVTHPDVAQAQVLANALVSQKLAACVQLLPAITSTYAWEGALHQEVEHLLLIKTTRARWPDLEHAVRDAHPYAVPQLVAVPVVEAHAPYLQWVHQQTTMTQESL